MHFKGDSAGFEECKVSYQVQHTQCCLWNLGFRFWRKITSVTSSVSGARGCEMATWGDPRSPLGASPGRFLTDPAPPPPGLGNTQTPRPGREGGGRVSIVTLRQALPRGAPGPPQTHTRHDAGGGGASAWGRGRRAGPALPEGRILRLRGGAGAAHAHGRAAVARGGWGALAGARSVGAAWRGGGFPFSASPSQPFRLPRLLFLNSPGGRGGAGGELPPPRLLSAGAWTLRVSRAPQAQGAPLREVQAAESPARVLAGESRFSWAAVLVLGVGGSPGLRGDTGGGEHGDTGWHCTARGLFVPCHIASWPYRSASFLAPPPFFNGYRC